MEAFRGAFSLFSLAEARGLDKNFSWGVEGALGGGAFFLGWIFFVVVFLLFARASSLYREQKGRASGFCALFLRVRGENALEVSG